MSDAKSQAKAQLSSIKEMVAALRFWQDEAKQERLVELQELAVGFVDETGEGFPHAEELAALEDEKGEAEDEDEARQSIEEDALSVEVRSGWASCKGDMEPEEFRILLCTGGPAVQIRGTLDQYGQPEEAWLEYQGWGTPWTRYYPEDVEQFEEYEEVLLEYASVFYYGE